jgi:flagellar assembly protein FliH
MSTSRVPLGNPPELPVLSFQYRQLPSLRAAEDSFAEAPPAEPEIKMTEEEFRRRILMERAAAVAEVEKKLQEQYQQKIKEEALRVSTAIEIFDQSRQEYFSRVEIEVVKLALSIAGKILHREAQVDPMLLAAVVQIALGQLKEGSKVVMRVIPQETARWRKYFDSLGLKLNCLVEGDVALQPGDCILETEIGMVNFSLDGQLKEVERGFFDVLASRPKL